MNGNPNQFGTGFIPDTDSMHNMNRNSINYNGQPQRRQPGVSAPTAFNTAFDQNTNTAFTSTEYSTQPSESGSSRLFSYNAGAYGQQSSQTSSSNGSHQRTQTIIPPQDGRPVLPQHLDPHDLDHQGAHFPNIPPYPDQVPDFANATDEELFSLFAEQDAPNPMIERSATIMANPQQNNYQPTEQMMFKQELDKQSHILRALIDDCNSSIDGWTPQRCLRIKQTIELLASMSPNDDTLLYGVHLPSLERQQMDGETAEPTGELDDDEEATEGAPTHGKSLKYQCIFPGCPKKIFGIYPTFTRHIETQHHPKVIFKCPVAGCNLKEYARRDKVSTHCKNAHLIDPRTVDIDGNKIEFPCPAKCVFCPKIVRSWGEFYKCFSSHCIVNDDSADNHHPTSHQHNPRNGGSGPAHGNGSNLPGSGLGGAGGIQPNGGYLGNAGAAQGYGFPPSWSTFRQMDTDLPPALDSRSSSSGLGHLAPPSSHPASNMLDQRRGSTDGIHPGTFRPDQAPGPLPRSQQPPQPEPLPREDLKCRRCRHTLCNMSCTLQRTIHGCHKCPTQQGILLQSSRTGSRGSTAAQRASVIARRTLQTRPAVYPGANMGPSGHGRLQTRQIRHHNRNRQGGGSQQPQDGPVAMMVISPPEPILGGYDVLKTSRPKATKAEPAALWLPFRGIPKSVTKILQLASSDFDEETPIQVHLPDLPLSPLVRPAPLFECRCPCVLKTKDTSFSHQAQLTPGKILDVNMKFVSERTGTATGHALRTRIRVVVKLFKLRSSVSRSGDKIKSNEDAKIIENVLKTSLDESALAVDSGNHKQSHDDRDDPDDSENSDLETDSVFSDTASQASEASEAEPASEVPELNVDPCKEYDSPKDDMLFPDDAEGVNSHTNDDYRFENASSRRINQDGELISSGHEINPLIPNEHRIVEVTDAVAFHEIDIERTEFEFSIDLDASTYLTRLSAWTDGLADVDLDALSHLEGNSNDSERVFQYFFRYLLYVIFTLSRSRFYPSPSLLE